MSVWKTDGGGGVFQGIFFCSSAAHFRRFLYHINVVPQLFNTSPGVVRSDRLCNATAKEMTWNVTVVSHSHCGLPDSYVNLPVTLSEWAGPDSQRRSPPSTCGTALWFIPASALFACVMVSLPLQVSRTCPFQHVGYCVRQRLVT